MEQHSEEWFAARLGKVTASKLSDVMMKPTTAGYRNYRAELIAERLSGVPKESFSNAAMQWGTDKEPDARSAYKFIHGQQVLEVGFIDHPTLAMTGASPDGLVGDDGLVEIKCPNTATHIDTLEGKAIDSKYIKQMHWQMLCTERKWCDFVSFDPRLPIELQLSVQRVELDKDLAVELEGAVKGFLAEITATIENLQSKYGMKEAA